ncbi:PaaI family thioesterase [Desulfuromonas acetoxidans]|uniref:Thioesterase superfamily n=1 Tax=Desulfuromonas acetoxidans (strain DSM 684 / 11070) TaxID=281689 RepID=Q1K391_DESA6|nr:PaaI family thioesterase [Desulfuromonas acetoxidans]EAT17083.1 thioesterase superfamily [Desulfuromonas acetoxidans DSM 684]MBF0645106.1 PaaI family thioesterase [Desulfuromonas acetoxidans]NVD24090.1 PaaI family thioesterase [Desulfuromonas acetoxidans]NVE16386.1 PaaI family thioesterase [Desulfuromonas acetoxidans]
MTSSQPIDLAKLLDDHLKDLNLPLQIPPPVLDVTRGEVVSYDGDGGCLEIRFPIQQAHLNPYGSVQGGMIATAIDNTIGPLSMLVAPPNYTRHLTLKYRRPIVPNMNFFTIRAQLLERQERQLTFEARVFDPQQRELVRATAQHWIVDLERQK